MAKDISVSIAGELEEEVNKETRATALNILRLLVFATPVGNPDDWQSAQPEGYVGGRARGSWFVGINSPNRSVNDDVDPNGTPSIQRESKTIASAMAMQYPTIIISSNIPYMRRLNDGWSKQAPKKFIETSVTRAVNAR